MYEAGIWATEREEWGQRSLEGRSPPVCHGTACVRFTTELACLILAVFSMLLLNNELKTGEQASLGADLPRFVHMQVPQRATLHNLSGAPRKRPQWARPGPPASHG